MKQHEISKVDRPNERLRVAFVAPRYHTNQIGIVKFLQARGHDVIFDAIIQGHTEDHSVLVPRIHDQCNISKIVESVLGVGGHNSPRSFPSPGRYFGALNEFDPHLVIIRSPRRYFSLLAAMCARVQGRKILFYDQSEVNRKFSIARRVYIKALLVFFNAAWFSPVEGDEENCEKRPEYFAFVPFLVPQSKIVKIRRKSQLQILAVGKFQERKNHLMLVEAMSILAEKFDTNLLIVGECVTSEHASYRQALQRKIDENYLESRVQIVTNAAYTEMRHFYSTSDLFVLPAKAEAASVALVEALAAGVPAICASSCGTRWYISTPAMGRVFDCGSQQGLIDAIDIMLSSIQANPRYKEVVHGQFEKKFGESAFEQSLYQLVGNRWGFTFSHQLVKQAR